MKINFSEKMLILPKYLGSIIKLQSIVITFIVLVLNVGCSNTLFPDNYIPLSSIENYEASSPDSVEIYVTQLPLKPYKEIGIFYFPTISNAHNPDKIKRNIGKIKEFAAQHGANAVIRLDVTDFNVKGVAIRWK